MKRTQLAAWLFCIVSLLGFSSHTRAEDSSLLGTILNEAVRQSHPQGEDSRYNSNRYADDDDDYYNDRHYDMHQARRVTCESQKGRHNYCHIDTQGRVRLERQLSNAPCREYDTWGVDGDGGGVWVSDGCRATFLVEPRRSGPAYGKHERGRGDRGEVILCESPKGRHKYCPTNGYGRIRLERQLSDAPCREYDTWGSDGDGRGVWVSNGCRAEFSVEEDRGHYDRD
jgi:hypothetical protein